MSEEKWVSTSLMIKPSLWKAFKIKCVELDIPVQNALYWALRDYLGMSTVGNERNEK